MSDGSWSNQVVSSVIIAGPNGQLLVYSPAPGAGNLVASVAALAGTDPFGNHFLGGTSSYSGGVATQELSDGIRFYTGSLAAGWALAGWLRQLSTATLELANPSNNISIRGTLVSSTAGIIEFGAQINLDPGQVISANDPALSPGNPETWHSLGTAGSTGLTLEFARYRLTPDGELEIDIALTGGPSTGGTYTWSNTLPAAYTPAGGNFLRIAPMAVNAALAGGVEDAIVAVDCAGAAVPGRVRMTIPNAITANFTCMARFPLN